MSIIRYWNDVSLRLVADDHTGNPPPVNQGGPTKTSRALALIHVAMHDVVAQFDGNFSPVVPGTPPPGIGAYSAEAAVCGAARRMMQELYPAHAATFDSAMAGAMGLLTGPTADIDEGVKHGVKVAEHVINTRKNDLPQVPCGYTYMNDPGKHRPDPFSPGQSALSPEWGQVVPFSYAKGAHPALKAPPSLTHPDYFNDYQDVRREGSVERLLDEPENCMKGIFWGYDGAQKLGTPPRLYNQVIHAVVSGLTLTLAQEARLYALINVGMSDAGIACWHWKYTYHFWRPVLGIREGGPGAGPLASTAGNPAIKGDPFWTPVGAPDTNGNRPLNLTPGFPAYPSGHSTFGSACFLLAAKFLGQEPKDIEFDFVSDEFNGVNRDSKNVVRPRLKRPFNLQEAIGENARSRVWLGVHWNFDAVQGGVLGEEVAELVYAFMGSPTVGATTPAPAAAAQMAPPPPLPGRRDPHR